MTALPRLRPVTPPKQDPVIGYVVVLNSERPRLTCADVMDREAADHEAQQFRDYHPASSHHYRVAKVVLL